MPIQDVWRRIAFWDDVQSAREQLEDSIAAHDIGLAGVTASLTGKADRALVIGAVKTSNYTFALNDDLELIRMSSASALVVTIPTNAAVPIPIGRTIPVARWNTGTVQIAVTGLTIRCARAAPYMISAQYGEAVLCTKVAADEWWLTGGLA